VGSGLVAKIDGRLIRVGSAAWVGSREVSADTSTRIHVSIDGHEAGYFRLANSYRSGLAGLLNSLVGRYRLMLFSGDHEGERSRLSGLFGQGAELYFNQSPHDKLRRMAKLTQEGVAVGMIGDGLNDAGALKEARVGLTVVEGSQGFSPASDGVVDSNSFEKLPATLQFCNDTIRVIKIGFVLSFIYNVVGLGFAVQGELSPLVAAVLMPVSSVSVVLFASLTTGFYARARGLTV